MTEEHYILMKDSSGEKAAGGLKKMVGFSSNTKQILRGELLRPIPTRDIQTRASGYQPNFYLERDPNVTLQASEDDVAPLSLEDYYLLLAVKFATDRFNVFSDPDWLEWGEKLRVGLEVCVRLPSPNPMDSNWSFAVIRYKGFVKILPGTVFGVEIKDERYRGKGTTDGVFQDDQFFKCDPDCGLYVSLDRLKWYDTQPAGIQGGLQSQQSSSKSPSYAAAASHVNSQSQPSRSSKKGSSDVDPPRSRHRFKIDDHVVVFDKHNTPLHGTVRWAGRKNRMGRDLDELHVGIEMIMYINPNDVPKAKTGLSDMFTAKKNHSIVIPESYVMAGEAYAETRSNKEKKNAQRDIGNPPPYSQRPIATARDYKMTEYELEEQKRLYREIESQKKKQDEEKLSHGVKEAIGESLTPGFIAHQQQILSEYQNNDKPSETGKTRNVREQQPGTEVNPDTISRDIRKQHSWQPQSHVYDEIPAAKDLANQHRKLAVQGKSSSVAQGEGIGDTFGHEGHQHYGLGVGGADAQSQMLQQNRDIRQYHLEKQARAHEQSHHGSQHHGGMPLSEGGHHSYGERSGYNPQPGQQQPGATYANIPATTEMSTYNAQHGQQQPGATYGNLPATTEMSTYNPQHGQQQPPATYGNLPTTTEMQGNHEYDLPTDARSKYPERRSDHSGAQHLPRAQPNIAASTAPPGSHAPMPVDPNLSVGSRIQIPTPSPTEPYKYGVIRWFGEIPGVQGVVAGIEMDDYMDGCTDGTLTSTGQKFFNCLPGRGIYYPLVNLQPDIRFADPATVVGGENIENPLDAPLTVAEDQFTEGRSGQMQRYIGDRRGIQGHQNSCYLDASIFGLFALTDAFDEMFLHAKSSNTADQNRQAIAELLWKGIVNPLRKNGVVRYESVMALRTKLDELGKMEGIAHAEKDPEEFLNMLFKYTLKVDPFLTIRRPYGDEPEFFVQLFVEYKESMKLPTVGNLLHTMFIEQKLSFLQMPSRLLVQVPRFGRQFKTYEKIIPDLKLNVSDLTEEYRQAAAQAPRCFVCNEIAESVCRACGEEFNKECYFCAVCEKQFHSHPKRRGHTRDRNIGYGVAESTLDLLSVICIETSHYVCFTKEPSDDPSKPPRWIFFDSMANRVYDRFNIPSVSECSDLLNEWVYPSNGDLSKLRNTAPRELPEFVRRFTQDLYLCVYINLDSVLYG